MHLLRTMAGACAIGALTLMLSSAASAQTVGGNGPFRIRIGGYLPSNGHTREALGTSFVSYGVGADLRRYESFLPATIEAYADYFDRIKHSDTFGRVQASVVGVGLLAKYWLDPNVQTATYKPYAGVGLGIYFGHLKQTTPDGFSQTTNRTTIGGKALLGTEINGGLFGELEYTFAPRPSIFGDKVNLSGTQVRIGFHF